MFRFGVALGSAARPGADTGSFEADLPFAGYGDSTAAYRTRAVCDGSPSKHQSLMAHSFPGEKARDKTNLQPMCYQISSSWVQRNPDENTHEPQKAKIYTNSYTENRQFKK